jgi:hypothetical protein
LAALEQHSASAQAWDYVAVVCEMVSKRMGVLVLRKYIRSCNDLFWKLARLRARARNHKSIPRFRHFWHSVDAVAFEGPPRWYLFIAAIQIRNPQYTTRSIFEEHVLVPSKKCAESIENCAARAQLARSRDGLYWKHHFMDWSKRLMNEANAYVQRSCWRNEYR